MASQETGAASHRLAAQDVIVRYAACIDDRDFKAYRGCFTEDVELHGFGREPIRGIDAWIAFVERAIAPYAATQHMLGPPRIELAGPEAEQAELRTELQAQHFYREPRGRIFTLWGTYRTIVVRADAGWKIQRHELQTSAVRTTDG